MKKTTLMLLVILSISTATKAQQETRTANTYLLTAGTPVSINTAPYGDPGTDKDYDYYMKKSRNNRTASWCLVGGGFVIAGIGALTFPKDYDILFENSSEKESKADAASALIMIGCAAMLTSIPFTIMAGVNKRKAKLMVSTQPTGQRLPPGISNTVTGMTISIAIGK